MKFRRICMWFHLHIKEFSVNSCALLNASFVCYHVNQAVPLFLLGRSHLEHYLFRKHILDTKDSNVSCYLFDQVDFIFYSSNQVSSLRKLLTSFSSCNDRQTVFASASIPQHRRFLHDCIQQKWMKVYMLLPFFHSICNTGPQLYFLDYGFYIFTASATVASSYISYTMVSVFSQNDVVHVHVNPVRPMPSCLFHRFVVSSF